MQRTFVYFLMIFLVLGCFTQAQSLVMVRCDQDESGFLSSPSQINLSGLQSSFDVNVDTVVFIHGYLTNFDDAKGNYESAVSILKTQLGKRNYVGFHWPSKVVWFGTAVENANQCGPYLMHILTNITKWYGSSNRKIHFVTHSLGARVMLNTLKLNSARYVKWGSCFNMAAAVHNNAYDTPFTGTNEVAQRNFIYHSDRDGVLKYIYSLYYFLFDRRRTESREFRDFDQMPDPQKIEYMRNLDENVQQGFAPETELDIFLCESMERAKQDAMGLSGSLPANKVENINVTDIASSHFYWSHTEVLKKIASKMAGQ